MKSQTHDEYVAAMKAAKAKRAPKPKPDLKDDAATDVETPTK